MVDEGYKRMGNKEWDKEWDKKWDEKWYKKWYKKLIPITYILLMGILIYTMGYQTGKVTDVINTNLISNSETLNWGLGFGEEGTTPTGNTSAEELALYDAYYVGDESEQVLYLTFDAGYENGNTENILDALKAHDVSATFFLVGNYVETNPELVIRMIEEGHTIGNHTYSHPDMTQLDEETFTEEMNALASLVQEVTGEEISMFYRPPQGKYSVDSLKLAQNMGYSTFFWSLAYVDWYEDDQPTKEEAFEKLLTRVHPGSIVLLHSTSQTNGEILDELLTEWENMGYRFENLETLVN